MTQGITYSVDIVLCIDSTGSMKGLIQTVKSRALFFYDDLTKTMTAKEKSVDKLRVKVISFRDYYTDGNNAMNVSPFFTLPTQKVDFESFVTPIRAKGGGGDGPENGMEALALAMQSEWSKEATKRRQIIVIWTDVASHPLEMNSEAKPAGYPIDLPKNFSELTEWWEGQSHMSFSAKRLIIFAPDAFPWTDIANYWSNVVHHPSKAGKGLSEIDYGTIIDVIASSV